MKLAPTSAAIAGLPSGAPFDDARTAVLDLYVAEFAQLFDAMDLAPFGERDLDPKIDAYIVDWAQDLPPTQSLHLVIHLGKPCASGQDAVMAGEAVHDYYAHRALATRRQLKKLFRLGRISLLIGVVFVGVAAGIGEVVLSLFTRERYATLVHESVVIGAWVALWRPMEIFLYDWWPIRAEARLFERLSQLRVRMTAMVQEGGVPS